MLAAPPLRPVACYISELLRYRITFILYLNAPLCPYNYEFDVAITNNFFSLPGIKLHTAKMQLTDVFEDVERMYVDMMDVRTLINYAETSTEMYEKWRVEIVRRFQITGTYPWRLPADLKGLKDAKRNVKWVPMLATCRSWPSYSTYVITQEHHLVRIFCSNPRLEATNDIIFTAPELVCSYNVPFMCVSAGQNLLTKLLAAVSTEGKAYTWGHKGNHLGLGKNNSKNQIYPVLVPGLSDIKVRSIAAGYFHCVAVASDGSVYTWGANEGGQCGHGNDHDIYSVPTRVEHLEDAKSSSAGKSHSLVVSKSGDLYSFGSGSQTGHVQFKVLYPEKVDINATGLRDDFVVMSASGETHSLALTIDGFVFSFGGSDVSPGRVRELDDIKVQLVFAGEGKCAAISISGDLYTWDIADRPRSVKRAAITGALEVSLGCYGMHAIVSNVNGDVKAVWSSRDKMKDIMETVPKEYNFA